MTTQQDRDILKSKLRDKIEGKVMTRSTRKRKEDVMEDGMKKMGIDKKKLMESMEIIRKSGANFSIHTGV